MRNVPMLKRSVTAWLVVLCWAWFSACQAEPGALTASSRSQAVNSACANSIEGFMQRWAASDPQVTTWWSQPHAAFGDLDNVIQLSWEREGDTVSALVYYRPQRVPNAQWTTWSLEQRATYLRNDLGGSWIDFVRVDEAPAFLRQTLKIEAGGRLWETTSSAYSTTLQDVFTQAWYVESYIGSGSRYGGFHYHVTFKAEPAFANDVARYIALADEHVALRALANNPGNAHLPYLKPHSSADINRIAQAIIDGSGPNEKFHFVGARSFLYGEETRMGIEVRGLSRDVLEAEQFIANVVKFLGDTSGPIKFGTKGNAYRLADLGQLEMLGDETTLVFADLYPFMQQASAAAQQQGGSGLLRNWALPLVRWETRSYLPPEVAQRAIAEREVYLQQLREIAAHYGGRPPGAEAQTTIENLLYVWARRTELFAYN